MRRALIIAFFIITSSFFLAGFSGVSTAQTEVDALRNQINERSQRLADIEKEIAQFEAALHEVGAEKNTLQKAINQLTLERKKVLADINYTETKIDSTDLQISKINIEISNTIQNIDENTDSLEEIMRSLNAEDDFTMIESLLSYDNLADYWDSIETLQSVRSSISDRVSRLNELRALLEEKRQTEQYRRGELVSLKDQYSDQQELLEGNQAEKDKLLKQTKNEEAEYQSLIAQKKAAQEIILREMRDFEAKLQFILDPTTIPAAGTAVFRWPLAKIVVTQYFGGTEFAARNASVYGGRAYHPGVDLGTPRGSPIYAPLGGTVRATGNTDAVPGCYSWGKWTLIDHPNGLSTLYAHQDLISVSPGQSVSTGDIIGYSGNTGYSTGPHLHFTVYASKGVSVRQFNEIKTSTSCGAATTPVAATEAYLDPMLYLPAI